MQDKSGEAATLNNIGRVYRLKDQIDVAMEYYQKAYKLLQKTGDWVNAAAVLSNIAMLHIEAENWLAAEKALTAAIEIDKAHGLPALEEDTQALEWVIKTKDGNV